MHFCMIDHQEKEAAEKIKDQVRTAFYAAEKEKKPSCKKMFYDVYDQIPEHLSEQEQELHALIKDYPDHFPLSNYETS